MEHFATLHSKDTNDWQKIFYLWNMWKGIHSSFKPGKHIVTTVGRNRWPQLDLIKTFNWKGTRWCTQYTLVQVVLWTNKKYSFKSVSWCCFKYKLYQHIIHMAMGLSLVWSYTFDSSLRCGQAYVSSRLWFWWNVCHNFFNVCIEKAFTQRGLSCASSSCVY